MRACIGLDFCCGVLRQLVGRWDRSP